MNERAVYRPCHAACEERVVIVGDSGHVWGGEPIVVVKPVAATAGLGQRSLMIPVEYALTGYGHA